MVNHLIPDDDILWVYRNLGDDSVTSDDAPNSGAWRLLRRAREKPSWFMHQIIGLPKEEKKKLMVCGEDGVPRPFCSDRSETPASCEEHVALCELMHGFFHRISKLEQRVNVLEGLPIPLSTSKGASDG